jgi:uncharacterized protein YqhQ
VRTPSRWAVALRRSDGTIHSESHVVVDRWPQLRRTFLRGVVALVDAISIGLRANTIAMRETAGLRADGGVGVALIPVAVAVIAIFVVFPGLATARWHGIRGDLAEASLRAAVLLVYLGGLSRSAMARRLFAYHGAEHKAIAAYERHGRVPSDDEASTESPVHVRCGTDFIALFVIVCGVVFAFVPREPMWVASLLRVALLPLVMALAYETMRAAAMRESSLISRLMTFPGRALQRITTREPSRDQLEIALYALRAAVVADGRGDP